MIDYVREAAPYLLALLTYFMGRKRERMNNEQSDVELFKSWKEEAKELTKEVISLREEVKVLREELHLYKTGKKRAKNASNDAGETIS